MKVAIVHEWLTIYGGSERVVEALHEMFPEAPIFALVYDKNQMPERFLQYDIRPTFVQKLPFAKKKYQNYLPIMPFAYEQLNLMEYDLVISSSSACAKGVITRSDAVHICYCHTPIRYAWEFYYDYINGFGKLKKMVIGFFMHKIRMWDRLAVERVDYLVANSHYIQRRIGKYYGRKSQVIFPPVNTHLYQVSENVAEYYLIVSRLVAYKRVDLAVEAFNQLGLPLIIIGDGPESKHLHKMANNNIKFLGRLTDEAITRYYSRCKGFIFCGEEDFGITPVEAQAAGAPVIALKKGGALDTVVEGKTGLFFEEQTVQSLISIIKQFETIGVSCSREEIKQYSEKFSLENFKMNMQKFIDKVLAQKEAQQNALDIFTDL